MVVKVQETKRVSFVEITIPECIAPNARNAGLKFTYNLFSSTKL